VPLHHHARC